MSDDNGMSGMADGLVPRIPVRKGRPRKSETISLLNGVIPELGKRSPARHRFREIPETIRTEGRVAGFERGRDILFHDYDELKVDINPALILKLGLDFDKHSLFIRLMEAKVDTTKRDGAYEEFQRYLGGETDLPPSLGTETSKPRNMDILGSTSTTNKDEEDQDA
jgi:hypothetical protein